MWWEVVRWVFPSGIPLGVPRGEEDWDVAANSLPSGANPAFHFEVRSAVCPFLGWGYEPSTVRIFIFPSYYNSFPGNKGTIQVLRVIQLNTFIHGVFSYYSYYSYAPLLPLSGVCKLTN